MGCSSSHVHAYVPESHEETIISRWEKELYFYAILNQELIDIVVSNTDEDGWITIKNL